MFDGKEMICEKRGYPICALGIPMLVIFAQPVSLWGTRADVWRHGTTPRPAHEILAAEACIISSAQ